MVDTGETGCHPDSNIDFLVYGPDTPEMRAILEKFPDSPAPDGMSFAVRHKRALMPVFSGFMLPVGVFILFNLVRMSWVILQSSPNAPDRWERFSSALPFMMPPVVIMLVSIVSLYNLFGQRWFVFLPDRMLWFRGFLFWKTATAILRKDIVAVVRKDPESGKHVRFHGLSWSLDVKTSSWLPKRLLMGVNLDQTLWLEKVAKEWLSQTNG